MKLKDIAFPSYMVALALIVMGPTVFMDDINKYRQCPAIDTRTHPDGRRWVGPRYSVWCEYIYLNDRSEPIGNIANLHGNAGAKWFTFIERTVSRRLDFNYYLAKDYELTKIGHFDDLDFAARDVEFRSIAKSEEEPCLQVRKVSK